MIELGPWEPAFRTQQDSVIGFFDWIVDDDVRRHLALEEARRNMEMVHQIGGKRIAAPGGRDR